MKQNNMFCHLESAILISPIARFDFDKAEITWCGIKLRHRGCVMETANGHPLCRSSMPHHVISA